MESQKQEFLIKELPTKSVVLYPSRAHITRDINDVVLKPGPNEIEIYGLTPTTDEQSVQLDGKGAATITDITVELVPNREIFEEVYPEIDEPQDEDDEEKVELEYCEEVKALEAEIEDLTNETKRASEIINSAARRLDTLDTYSKTLKADKSSADDVAKTMSMYEEERSKIFAAHCDASEKLERCQKEIDKKEKLKFKAGIADRKRHDERLRARQKEDRRKALQRQERLKETNRIKEERLKFWPKKVYRVTVNLETPLSIDTPMSSRRGSMDSVTIARDYTPPAKDGKAPASTASDDTVVSLSLSYVTRDASWTPRYDLNISSVQKSAAIAYRAELVNGTSETWKDAQLILSTSQTSYQGLEDKAPFMHAWHVKLGRYQDQGLLSPEEINHPRGSNTSAPVTNRNELFGSSQNVFVWGSQKQQKMQQQQVQQVQQAQQAQAAQPQYYSSHTMALKNIPEFKASAPAAASFASGGAFAGASLFGQSMQNCANTSEGAALSHSIENVRQRGERLDSIQSSSNVESTAARSKRSSGLFGGFGSTRKKSAPAQDKEEYRAEAEEEEDEDMGFGLFDDGVEGSSVPGGPVVGYQEASWDDHGLTSTYEVPGARTVAPSSLSRRHKIASLMAANIHLSHIAVPKLRAAAFLRAKIRNPSSSVTLLKGTAGVTLDGSFLGNMVMGRVSPGQIFDLPLGVDPALQISYPKPSVHRATQGIFSKESAQVFTRSVWVTNTKTVPVELLVLDQVPLSEDERLSISILQPRGLSKEGDTAKAGSAAKEGASGATHVVQNAAWGKATATLKKDGQVAWTANVEKKQGCLLTLEYEARMPAAERITPA